MSRLTATRMTSPLHPYTDAWWALYESAFPASERRCWAVHAEALRDTLFHCLYLADDSGFVGLLTYWQLAEVVYVEHLAIVPELRGGGYGHAALELLTSPVILEIEPVVDALTARRLAFYRSCGFVELPTPHVQLAYQVGQPDIPLLLLSRPFMDEATVARFEQLYLEHPMRYRDSAGR